MGTWAVRYRINEGQYGLKQIEVTGRCLDSDAATIEAGCTRRWALVPLPNASGAVLKALDGSRAALVEVTPPTVDWTFRCVKVDAFVNPFAPTQEGGSFNGHSVCEFRILYQEVGGVA